MVLLPCFLLDVYSLVTKEIEIILDVHNRDCDAQCADLLLDLGLDVVDGI